MITKELVDFIKAEQAKGKNEEEIKTLLIQNGWNEGDIKEGLDPVGTHTITEEEKYKRLLKTSKIVFFVGLLPFLISFLFIFLPSSEDESSFEKGLGAILFLFIFGIPLFIAFLLQSIYGIKLLGRNNLWAILNLMFPVLILLYIMFGALVNSFN